MPDEVVGLVLMAAAVCVAMREVPMLVLEKTWSPIVVTITVVTLWVIVLIPSLLVGAVVVTAGFVVIGLLVVDEAGVGVGVVEVVGSVEAVADTEVGAVVGVEVGAVVAGSVVGVLVGVGVGEGVTTEALVVAAAAVVVPAAAVAALGPGVELDSCLAPMASPTLCAAKSPSATLRCTSSADTKEMSNRTRRDILADCKGEIILSNVSVRWTRKVLWC